MSRVSSCATGNMSDWNFVGAASSELMMNLTGHDEDEVIGWTASSANALSGSNLGERRMEATSLQPMDDVEINLNNIPVVQEQNPPQGCSFGEPHQTSGRSVGLSANDCPAIPVISSHCNPFESEAAQNFDFNSSVNAWASSNGGTGYFSQDVDGQPGSSMDGQRISGKRKNIEESSGQSSGSESQSCFQQSENLLHASSARNMPSNSLNITRSSGYFSNQCPPEEHFNSQFNSGYRPTISECLSSLGTVGSLDGSQRNFRFRVNPSYQASSSLTNFWALGNPSIHPSVWSAHQSSSFLVPPEHSLENRQVIPRASSESHPYLLSVPSAPHLLHPLLGNGTSNSGVQVLDDHSNASLTSTERSASLREEGSSRGIQRSNVMEQYTFLPAVELRNVAQVPINWNMTSDNGSFQESVASSSRVGSSAGVHPSIQPTWISHSNPPNQHPQALSQSLQVSPASVSDGAGQFDNSILQHASHSNPSQEVPQHGSVICPYQPFLRSAFLMDRRSDAVSASLRLRTAREGRRMISEHIRNALDLMVRGENVRFEAHMRPHTAYVLGEALPVPHTCYPSVFYGVADLHDRHRDMRLDVDNMSYEELLALEEQIGNVSTGLSEETILNHLKQRKYSSGMAASPGEAEPCCICQEEYVDDEALGTLECGHGFHALCIKQWLMHKNLCPICKTTALVT